MSARSVRLHLFRLLLILMTGVICMCFNSCRLRSATVHKEEVPSPVIESGLPAEVAHPIRDDGPGDPQNHKNDPDHERDPEHEKQPDHEKDPMHGKQPMREQAADWVVWYNERWGDGAADEIILTADEITQMNERIIRDCRNVVDIAAIPETMDGSTVRAMIERYTYPDGALIDNDGTSFDDARRQAILDNRALDAIGDTVSVRPAIITSRCNLKGFPTALQLYNQPDRRYSQIQETELIVSFPVWVLHQSADSAYLFVQSYFYAGWIPADAAALCTPDEFTRFAVRDHYATVTSPTCVIDGVRLDMGAALPFVEESEDGCLVQLPFPADHRSLLLKEALLPSADGLFGSLPYTAANFYNQAFAYLGTPYAWGGVDGGVDCSGYVCAVCRTFGIYLPRNSGEQEACNGYKTDLAGRSADEKLSAISEVKGPATLHRKGHVMILLGVRDGVCYIIHAPGGGSVIETPFTQLDVLTAVDQIG